MCRLTNKRYDDLKQGIPLTIPPLLNNEKQTFYENTNKKSNDSVRKPFYVNSDPAGIPAPVIIQTGENPVHVYEEIKNNSN